MKKFLIVTVIVVVCGIFVGFLTYLFPGKNEQQIILASISGDVKIIRNDDLIQDLQIGMRLLPSDIIITEMGSYATLKLRDLREDNYSSVTINPKSKSTIGEIVEDFYEIGLDAGQIYGDVNTPLRVRLKGEQVAETEQGSFGITTDEQGNAVVGVEKGEVVLSSAGESQTIREGEQAFAAPGIQPSKPMKMPSSLLLKVKWPEQKELSQRFLVLEGKTNAGSRIIASDGQSLVVDPEGNFRIQVELEEGLNKLKVEAVDALGNTKEAESPDINVDTQAPEGEIGAPVFGGGT